MTMFRALKGRAVAVAAAALAACAVHAPVAAQDAPPTPPSEEDFVLLKMRVKNYTLNNDMRGYQIDNGICLDLADVILALDLPVRLDKKSRRATGWLFREDQTITIDRDKNTVQIVNEERPLLPGEIFDTPEGWCVDARTLAGWMDVTLKPRLFDSAIDLVSEKPLPFIEAIERKSRAARLREKKAFDLDAFPKADMPYRMWRAPSVDVVADMSVQSGGGRTTTGGRYQVYASGEIAKVSYNARLASDYRGVPQSLRMRAFRTDPDGTLLGPLKATQVAAGDVELLSGNLAGATGVGRGAFVSNRSVLRPTRFGTTVLRGALPIGWDAELYRNGQLLAFQSETADGRYEFEVDLVFGDNDLEVVLYGPQGQVRRETQRIPVGQGALEPGKLEYWAGVAERGKDLLSFGDPSPFERGWQYGFGVQYGVDKRTVAGFNAHSVQLSGRRRNYAELELQRAFGSFLIGVTAAQELGRGRAYSANLLGRVGKVFVEAQSFFVDGPFVSGIVTEDERASHRFRLETTLGSGRRVIPVSAGYRRSERRDGRTVDELTARASLVLPRIAFTGVVTNRRLQGPSNDEEGTFLGLLANTRILGLNVRGETEYKIAGPDKGWERARLTVERPLDERSDLRFEIEHEARSNISVFRAGYVRQFDRLALGLSANVDSEGAVGASVALNFSFRPDPFDGGLLFSHTKLAQRGQAAVSVFVDENGDGIRSPGEKALPGVTVNAGQFGTGAPTDENGHAVVSNLAPFQPVLVSIDESTLPDPFMVPVDRGIVVTPRAGIAAELQFAVAPTGEVEGVLHGLEDTPRPGVELELVGRDGNVVATTLSEFDGFFLFERVPYGSYRVRLAPGSARALGTAQDLGASGTLAPGETLVQLGIVRIRTNTMAAAGPDGTGPQGGPAP